LTIVIISGSGVIPSLRAVSVIRMLMKQTFGRPVHGLPFADAIHFFFQVSDVSPFVASHPFVVPRVVHRALSVQIPPPPTVRFLPLLTSLSLSF